MHHRFQAAFANAVMRQAAKCFTWEEAFKSLKRGLFPVPSFLEFQIYATRKALQNSDVS